MFRRAKSPYHQTVASLSPNFLPDSGFFIEFFQKFFFSETPLETGRLRAESMAERSNHTFCRTDHNVKNPIAQ
jgi:hypothetical protein